MRVGPEPTLFIGLMEERVSVSLWDHIERYLSAEDVELDDLRWSGRVLKITVDAEGGVDVDRIAELSRGIARMLDDEPSLTDAYTLEVGSPGLERPLRRPSHYHKAIGREVTVTTLNEIDDETHHRGVLKAYDDSSGLVLAVEGVDREIPNSAVKSARTVFTWEAGTKPGKGPAKKKKVS